MRLCSLTKSLRSPEKLYVLLQNICILLQNYYISMRNFSFTHKSTEMQFFSPKSSYFYHKSFTSECKVSRANAKVLRGNANFCERMQHFSGEYAKLCKQMHNFWGEHERFARECKKHWNRKILQVHTKLVGICKTFASKCKVSGGKALRGERKNIEIQFFLPLHIMQNFSGERKNSCKWMQNLSGRCKLLQANTTFHGGMQKLVRERKNIKIQFFLQPHIIPDMKVLQSNQVERHKSTEIFPPNLIFYHHHIPYRKVVNLDVI